jgi:5-aminopentanamidase
MVATIVGPALNADCIFMTVMTLALLQAAPMDRGFSDVLNDLDAALRDAAAQQADLLLTPELFVCGYGQEDRARAMAVSQDSPFLRQVGALVKAHGVGLVLGYSEQAGAQRYNSAAYFDPSGVLAHNYRKQYLPSDYEKACFSTGSLGSLFTVAGVQCALLICYDIEFPENARKAALAGASVLLIPTALNANWRIVSDVVIPSRAYENSIFVAYCDFAASDQGPGFAGLSKVCGPDGRDLIRANLTPALITTTLDLDEIRTVRDQLHMLQDVARTMLP